MSIHSEIKRLRQARGWSHAKLAEEVSKAEGRATPLAWQTVQQWEREPSDSSTKKSTAPSRRRMEIVADLFGVTVTQLLSGEAPTLQATQELNGSEGMLVAYFRMLKPEDQQEMLHKVAERAAQYIVDQQSKRQAAA